MFDLDRLEAFAVRAIAELASAHEGELFDGFAIDAAMLCLSLHEDTEAGRAYLVKEGRASAEELEALRRETGDWRYQGFAEMGPEQGFDREAYREHYRLDEQAQRTSAYGRAMDELLARLTKRGVFEGLRRTDDFLVIRVEHGY